MPDKRFPGPESIFTTVLSNGIKVLIYENHVTSTVTLDGVLASGGMQDTQDKEGLADFTADLLMHGTEQRTSDQIFEELESVGASLGFSAGRHVTHFSTHCLVEDFDSVVHLLAESLRHPVFPAERVEKVRGQIVTGLQMRSNSTGRMAALKFMETAYRGHPFARSIHGYPISIQNINQGDLIDFHRRHYGPRDMVISLAGAVDSKSVVAKLEDAIGDWRNDQQPGLMTAPDMALPDTLQRIDLPMADKVQVDIVLGSPGPRRAEPDYLQASLMNTILGVFGMMGRIGLSLREQQGLAYHASSQLRGGLGPSPWMATAGVAPDNVTKAIAGIQQEIRRIQERPVSMEELEDAKAYRVGSLPVGLETNGAVAAVMLDMHLYDLGLDFLQRFPDEIALVTPADIQAVARKYLDADRLVVVAAGPINGSN